MLFFHFICHNLGVLFEGLRNTVAFHCTLLSPSQQVHRKVKKIPSRCSLIEGALVLGAPCSSGAPCLSDSPCCAHDTASSYTPHAASCSFPPFAHLSSRQHGLYPVLFYDDGHLQLNSCLYQQYLHLRRRKNHAVNKDQWQLNVHRCRAAATKQSSPPGDNDRLIEYI